ncbi:MAG: hypothetical protein AB1589_37040 [Cyanobacteriota bacterium]
MPNWTQTVGVALLREGEIVWNTSDEGKISVFANLVGRLAVCEKATRNT